LPWRYRQVFLALAQGFEQLLERVTELQAAQARGVGRADVDGHIAGVGVDLVQAEQVVIYRTFHRGVEVLADIDPEDALVLGGLDPRQQVIDAQVVEPHAIDDRLGLRQAENARLGIARLRTRRHGADLDKTEAQLRKAVDGRTVLVQASCQAHRVGKSSPITETGIFAGALHTRPLSPRRPPAPIRSRDRSWEVSGESLNNSWRARVYMGGLDSDGGERWRRL
jgi:hypothetical protein